MGQQITKTEKKPRIVPDATHGEYYNRVLLSAATLQCPICIDVFAGTPLMLHCGHSLCHWCLERMIASDNRHNGIVSRFVECPLCRQKTYLKDGGSLQSLPKNFTLQTILDDVRAVAVEHESFVVFDETLKFENKRLTALLKEKDKEIEKLRSSTTVQTNLTFFFQMVVAIVGVGLLKMLLSSTAHT